MKQLFFNLRSVLIIVLFVFSTFAQAQSLTQTVRGTITDLDTKTPLPGASVLVVDSDPLIGSATDMNGNFRLANVPVGRVTLKITSIGYEDRLLPNVLVVSGKENVLQIEMRESFYGLDEIVVMATKDKSEILNELTLVSARGFTVEETKRYAGSFNDPARMVSAYAGVNTDASGNNDIIVRGNNPRGIQWRLEDIEIPNPNHFTSEGLTAGAISALNSNMLSNSEFHTGAFSPQYGNALSGVFDIKLRKGNNEKREYTLSAGVLGTDFTAEGPFKQGGNSSFLVNYRYSTLDLLDKIGAVDFDGVPKYQDMSYKMYFPTKKLGTFSLFGLGGKSNIAQKFFDEENEDLVLEQNDVNSDLLVNGITQYWPITSKVFLQNTLAMAYNSSGYMVERDLGGDAFSEFASAKMKNNTFRASSSLNYKINSRHQLQGGYTFSSFRFDFMNRYHDKDINAIVTDLQNDGSANLLQSYVSWKWRASENLTLVTGLHSQKSSLNDEVTVEPRTAVRWDFAPSQAFTLGFGQHSKMNSLPNHYGLVANELNPRYTPNVGLRFAKAYHYVLGYENKLGEQLFLKAEAYFQDLFDVPIEDAVGSTYSLINQQDLFSDRVLVNEGKGKNYGLEITLERYFHNNYFFMVTASIFNSEYMAKDGVWRSTMFNSRYITNYLFGKEFLLNSTQAKKKVIGINGRAAIFGPSRITPINLEESIAQGRTIWNEDRAFSQKGDGVFSINLGVTYRIDRPKASQELKLDIQNLTNNDAIISSFFNDMTKKIEYFRQLPMLPVLSYTVNF